MKSLKLTLLFSLSIITYTSLQAQLVNILREPISLTNDPLNLIYGSLSNSQAQRNPKELETYFPTTNPGTWTNQYGPYGIAEVYSIAVEHDTGNLVLASTSRGIMRSINGGNTWQYIGGFSNPMDAGWAYQCDCN